MPPAAQKARKPGQWAASAIEQRPIASLLPYAQNARTHSEDQVSQIAASIAEFGFVNPVLVDEGGEIIAGHGRVLAAQFLGLAAVPAIVRAGLTDAQKRGLRLADNKLALNSGWDETLLAAEIAALQAGDDFDIALTGFSIAEIDALLAQGGGGGGAGGADGDGADEPLSPEQATQTLAQRFGVAPFSVLNAREGWWQTRKRAWIALGIQSEVGRGENLLAYSDTLLEPDPAKRAARKAAKAAADGP